MLTNKLQLQLLGDFVLHTPYYMALPLDADGGLPSPRDPAISTQPWTGYRPMPLVISSYHI